MLGCIYLVTNKSNNKKYIGQHCKPDPKNRWDVHKGSKDHLPFHKALRKYGLSEFKWEVLIICPHDALTNMEGYYAEQFESYIWDSPGGYNAAWCSESPTLGIKHSPEACEKIRQAKLGKKHSPEACENMRQAGLGKKKSPEAIEKMRQAKLGRKRSPEAIEKMKLAWKKRKEHPPPP